MCGIIGYIGPKSTSEILIQGLIKLEYRGYDSSGVVINNNGEFYISRQVGRVEELEKIIDYSQKKGAGIAHTRWATHGGVTVENAHPHLSKNRSVALVHNGIIENYYDIKKILVKKKIPFSSETDSEVLSQLIEEFYCGRDIVESKESPLTKNNPTESIKEALKLVRGTWGIAVMFNDRPNEIYAARNGSPLIIGVSSDASYISSDPHAITPHTNRVIFLNDGDFAKITLNDLHITREDGRSRSNNIVKLDEEWGSAEKGGYPHFMLKEIYEQPEALRQCLLGRTIYENGTSKLGGLSLSSEDLCLAKEVVLLGCGTSYYASQVAAIALERIARIPSAPKISSEFRFGNPIVNKDSLYFAVTQSGETADTLGAVREVKVKGGKAMGVVNVVGSTIARECGRGVYIRSGPEMAVASTKAFSSMIMSLYLFVIQMARARSMSLVEGQSFLNELLRVPDKISEYLNDLKNIDEAVRAVCQSKSVIFIGRGYSYPVASEGALKLMEIAYIPCLAYASGELKHGPIALIEEDSLVIVIAPDDYLKDKTISNLQECKARGAKICLIHTEGDAIESYGDISISIPKTHESLSPFLSVLPLQIIAYRVALAMGRNIDRPRNLAKSVTVD